MNRRRGNERGSAAMLAIFAMLFLGIIIAGLLPMLTMESRSAVSDRDALQARYAAEAGVKRAYAAMIARSTNWSWLTPLDEQNIVNVPLRDNSNANYYVMIDPMPTNNQGPTPRQYYTITARGSVGGGYIKEAKGKIAVLDNVPGGLVVYDDDPLPPVGAGNWGGGSDNPNPPNPPPPLANDIIETMQNSGYISYNIGTNLTINHNVSIEGGILATSASNITNQSGATIQTGVNLIVPPIPISLAPATYSSATPLSGAPSSGTNALSGTYYVSGGLNTNSHTVLSATGGTSGDVTIFANGPINIGDNVVTNASTNLTLASSSNITINSNVDLVGNIQLYAKEDLIINSNSDLTGADLHLTGYGLFMAGRDIYINSNVNLNKAVLIAGRDLIVNANSTITGQIIAGRNIILNSNCRIIMADVL